MTELFISYSRKDKDFVHRLHDALIAAKREVWVDWEDIPLASDWRAEIFAGIEAADSFAFIISPDSVISQVCGEELEHAIQNKKRLIPILYREEQAHTINPVISSHNWIYFRNDDDFDGAVGLLLKTLDTDLSYVRIHTRLLVRAKEWESKGRNPSFLLRGADLKDAEQWQVASADKQPEPTALQLGYIAASRSASTARQRVIASVLAVGIVIALLLSVVAFQQYLTASAALKQSDTNLHLANTNLQQAWTVQSLFLAAESMQQSKLGNSQAALLLALESAKHIADGIFPQSIHQAMFTALTMPGQEIFDFAHDGPVNGAAWNSDESRILTWASDGNAKIWAAQTGKLLLTVNDDYDVANAAWNKDETRIVTWGSNQSAMIWDAQTGKKIYTFKGEGDSGGALWKPDGSALLVWSADHSAQVIDAQQGKVLLTLKLNGPITKAAWSKDGTWIAASAGSEVKVWDAQAGTELADLTHSAEVKGVMWGIASDRLFTWADDMTMRMWDWQQNHVLMTVTDDAAISGMALNADEGRILTWAGNHARVWDSLDGKLIASLNHNDSVFGAAWNNDGSRVLTWANDSTARVWDAATGQAAIPSLTHGASVFGAVWSPDNTRILTWSYDMTIRVWDASNGQGLYNLSHGSTLAGGVWNKDGSRILTWAEYHAHLVDTQNGQGRLNFPLYLPNLVIAPEWSKDESQLLTVSSERTATIWDARTGSAVHLLHHDAKLLGATWSPDERDVLSWSVDGVVNIWDSKKGTARLSLSHPQIIGAVWNKTGSQIITWSKDHSLNFWDATNGNKIRTLTHNEDAFSVLWNADGSRLVTWSSNGTGSLINVWDANSGKLVNTFTQSQLNNVTWNADGKRLLIASADGTLKAVDTETGQTLLTLTAPSQVYEAIWTRDNSRILGNTANGEVWIWDAKTGQHLLTLAHNSYVTTMTLSNDDSRLLTASADEVARIWDIRTGELLDSMGHKEMVIGATWNKDNTRVLTWSQDTTAAIFGDKTLLFTLSHLGPVEGAEWSKDEHRVLTWSDDGYAHIWLLDFDELFAMGNKRVLSPLDNNQRTDFFLPTLEPTATLEPTQIATSAATP